MDETIPNRPAGEFFSPAAAVAGNLFLAGLFLNALLRPLENADFIFRTGMWLFMVEFFSIFLSGLSFRRDGKSRRDGTVWEILFSLPLLGLTAMIVAFGYFILRSFYMPMLFIASSVAKGFGKKAGHGESRTWIYVFLLLFSTMIVFGAITPERLVQWFPISDEVLQRAPEYVRVGIQSGDIRGEFVERPQTLLAWGILYYSLAAVLEMALFFGLPATILKSISARMKKPPRP